MSSSRKRSRLSLACIQCRRRKVKCDFTHPQCSRCAASDSPCAYADAPPRVDSQAFDQLGNHVVELHKRMKMMQSELNKMLTFSPLCPITHNNTAAAATWTLTLTPTGIRINTNITNIHELYQILLQGITRLEINNRAWINVPSFVSSSYTNNVEALPVVSSYPCLIKQEAPTADLQLLVHSCYQPCFLPYQIVDQREFLQKCHDPQSPQDLLLVNSIHAWVAKHTSIYHRTLSNSATAVHAAGEDYFLEAKQLLRRCFTISNATTIHALLNLYMYQLSCERTTLAYLYIGLAIRMAEDLGLHKKDHNTLLDLKQKEINKRLWWSVYWLDLCAALESNRPTMVDDKDCDMEYPTRLLDEDDETGYRIAFSMASIQLMKIRKVIAKHLPSEGKSGSCLLDAVAHLESRLKQWLQELPAYFSFSAANNRGTAFCDEACLILNIQYHTTWIMLHKLFLKEQQDIADSPVALLSLDVCIRSANMITQLLQIYAQQPHWCHFYYCLDGVAESVYIHQKNVSCNTMDTMAKQTALNHLTTTLQILYESPLKYMQKMKDIIYQIRYLLEEYRGQAVPSPPQSQSPPQDICQTLAVTTERVLLRHPHVNIMEFIQPTFSNEELNQMLSIYNDENI